MRMKSNKEASMKEDEVVRERDNGIDRKIQIMRNFIKPFLPILRFSSSFLLLPESTEPFYLPLGEIDGMRSWPLPLHE